MIDTLYNKYKNLIDNYRYDANISHILYVIIPAFIIKYPKYEKLIIDMFNNTKIITSNKQNKSVLAYYTSIPKYINSNLITEKYVVINNYNNVSLVSLLDSMIHEFNHALHSYNFETYQNNNLLYLRTGLAYISYNLPELSPNSKDNSYILEEILNTKQTEEIINIIKTSTSTIESISTMIYAINNETDTSYNSNAYNLEKLLFTRILENKTFINTLNNLRITGNVSDLKDWFDSLTDKGDYDKLNSYLEKIMKYEIDYENKNFITKKIIINKIRTLIDKILIIINKFNTNSHYKY